VTAKKSRGGKAKRPSGASRGKTPATKRANQKRRAGAAVRPTARVRAAIVSAPAGGVVAVLARVLRQSASAIPGHKIKDLATCDPSLCADIVAAINDAWPGLLPPFGQSDVHCADTSDDLDARIASRIQ
jgi:hypothetical protein